MKKLKQILAIVAIIIILGLYATTFVLAVLGNTISNTVFMASLYATVGVPCMLYVIFWLAKVLGKKE